MGAPRKGLTQFAKKNYFFLFGRCVSADAAADLAALEDFGSRSTLAAADAAFALVTSEFLRRAILKPSTYPHLIVQKPSMFSVSLCIFSGSAARY